MQTGVLAARLVLAAIFMLAGIGKLLDREGSRRALEEFGMPLPVITGGAILLPLCELAIAAALVLRPSARSGAIAAAVLLLAFVISIANALAHKRSPECQCFGQVHSAPAGKATLARNGLFLLLALFVAWQGTGPAIDRWASTRSESDLVLSGVGVLALALLAVLGRVRVGRRARERNEARDAESRRRSGLALGSRAPEFDLPGVCGPSASLASLRARGQPVMVLFADPDCTACRQLFPDVGRWQQTLAARLTIAVISNGDGFTSKELCDRYGIADVLRQSGSTVLTAYRMTGTPSAVIIDRDGHVTSDTAAGYEMIHALVRITLRRMTTENERWEPSVRPV